ncbi:MAG: hypothetical protein L6Q99_06895 [Planctomycetes bacterium]|nr:hypothetical protein [Planctomycetota bacterium]
MSAELPTGFCAETEALLREAAAAPDSLLLRAPRRAIAASAAEPVKPSATGLSTLERHLLRAFREEVAALLRDECRRRLAKMESPLRFTLASLVVGHRSHALDAPSMVRVEAELAESVEWRELGNHGAPVRDHIARMDVEQVSELAQRFAPSPSSELHAGLAAFARGANDVALRRFAGVAQSTVSQTHLSAAWTNAGLVRLQLGDLERARMAYRRAWQLQASNAAAVLSDAFVSVQLGDAEHLRDKRADIEAVVLAAGMSVMDEYEHTLVSGRRLGLWTPTKESARLVSLFSDARESVLRRLVRAFH